MAKKRSAGREEQGRLIIAARFRTHVDNLPLRDKEKYDFCNLLASAFGDALDGDQDAMEFVGAFMRTAYEHNVEFAVKRALRNLQFAEAAFKQGGTA